MENMQKKMPSIPETAPAMKPQRVEPNAHEIHGIEFIAGLDAQIAKFDAALKPRLQCIPNGYRDFRLARKLIEKTLDGLYDTMPQKTLLHMQRLNELGEVVIRPRPAATKGQYVQIVDNETLKFLINKIIASECAICLNDRAGVKKCRLRKALNLVVPPDAQRFDGACPYRDVAITNELGEYI